jgi:hypothetical protein
VGRMGFEYKSTSPFGTMSSGVKYLGGGTEKALYTTPKKAPATHAIIVAHTLGWVNNEIRP